MNKIEKLKPFKYLCMTIGALPTSYLESMTYYETLCWLCKYLEKTVIPTVNNNGTAVEELQTKYLELVDYVNNYFESLDYQTEVNQKLDEMAQDGTLADIINVEMIGSLEDLTTTDKSDIVSAINEVNANIGNIPAIGDLADLDTTVKSDLVSAINEVNTNTDTNTSNITTNADNIATNTANITSNTNAIGDITDLNTTVKSDLVSAINEVNSFSDKFTIATATISVVESEGLTPVTQSTTIEYPTGFNKNNTMIIEAVKTIPNKTDLYIGATGGTNDYTAKNPGIAYVLGDDYITVRLATIRLEGYPEYRLAVGDYVVKMLLMKI